MQGLLQRMAKLDLIYHHFGNGGLLPMVFKNMFLLFFLKSEKALLKETCNFGEDAGVGYYSWLYFCRRRNPKPARSQKK